MLNKYMAFDIIKFRHMLTPFAIDFHRCFTDNGGEFEYKAFYIFGIRIARWRINV